VEQGAGSEEQGLKEQGVGIEGIFKIFLLLIWGCIKNIIFSILLNP
jgi:hypothetical protein